MPSDEVKPLTEEEIRQLIGDLRHDRIRGIHSRRLAATIRSLQQENARLRTDEQLFRDQLQEALGLPKDRVWFGTGLLCAAQAMRKRKDVTP